MSLVPNNQYDSTGGDTAALIENYSRVQPLRLERAWPQAVLRSVCVGSAGVVGLVAGYELYIPHVGTSPSIVDSRAMARVVLTPVAPSGSSAFEDLLLSVADQAREVLAALSLNKSQLAEVLAVSRPTLYDWLDGKEPNASNSERLTTLLRLLARAGVASHKPLHARFIRQPLREGSLSLLDELRAQSLDEAKIGVLLRDAKALGEKAESRRVAREDRLRALGFEDPSDQQRREQLARNVALRDWPKT